MEAATAQRQGCVLFNVHATIRCGSSVIVRQRKMASHTKQFLSLPLAVLGTFVASGLIGAVVLEQFTCWLEPVVGPFCATTVIAVTFWLAPTRKRSCALIVLLLGILFAWWLLRRSYYPEWHARAYQPTIIPLVATISAGILNYAFWCFVCYKKKENASPASDNGYNPNSFGDV